MNSDMIEVFPSGVIVRTVIGHVEGMITACSIRFEKANYEITYFVGNEQRTVWMFEQEFTTEATKINIGFK